MPAALASSIAYWISGLSTTGSISLGIALVAGKKRVPSPATGNTALRTGFCIELLDHNPWHPSIVGETIAAAMDKQGETLSVAEQSNRDCDCPAACHLR